jgi:hypothetical protein
MQMLRKFAAGLGILGLMLTLTACPKGGDITPGGKCSFEGDKHTNSNGYNYTCQKNPQNGALIWAQDTQLDPDRP